MAISNKVKSAVRLGAGFAGMMASPFSAPLHAAAGLMSGTRRTVAPQTPATQPTTSTVAQESISAPQVQPAPRPYQTPAVVPPPIRGLFQDVPSSVANPQRQNAWENLRARQANAQEPMTYGGLVKTLAERAQKPSEQVKDAFEAQQAANEALKKFRESAATTKANIYDDNTSFRIMQGRDAALQQAVAEREAALGSSLESSTALYNASLTGQGQQLTALGTAAGYAQPSPTAYGQTVFNPLAGGFAGGGVGAGMDPVANLPQIVEAVLNKQLSPAQALAMGGSVQNWQNVLANELLKRDPSANLGTLQGQFDARQQATTIAGVAPTAAAADLYGSQFGPVNQLQAQLKTVDQYGNLLLGSMQGINQTQFAAANTTIGNVQRHLTQEQRALYNNTLATLQASVSQMLSTGSAGLPSDVTQKANQIIDGTLPVSQLAALLQRINQEGNIRLGAQADVLNTGAAGIGAQQKNYGVPYQGPLTVNGVMYIRGADGKYYAAQ